MGWPAGAAAAVLFEGEVALKHVEDHLDPLAAAGEFLEPGGLVLAVLADQVRGKLAGDALKSRPARPLSATVTWRQWITW